MNPFNIFKRSAPQGTIQKGGSSLLMWLSPGGTQRRTTRREQLDAYAGWVYAAVTLLADDFAAAPFRVLLNDKVKENSALALLLRNFVGLTTLEAKTLTLMHLLLTGEAFWLVITAGGKEGGRPIGLQVLNPDWLEVESTNNGVSVTSWRLSVPGFNSRVVDGRDVLHFKLPNPTGDVRGYSPVRAFALSYDSDLYARAYSADLLKNQARPDGILSSDQQLSKDQADTLKARWMERVRAGEIAVLGQGMKYMPVASSLKDLEFLSLAQLNREAVLGIYRVPASKLGLDTSRSQADAGENTHSYEANALRPHVRRFDDAVNASLARRVGTELLEHEDPVRENRIEKRKEALELWQSGLMTANQALEFLDWDILAGLEGNVRMLPNTHRIVDKLEASATTPAVAGATTPDEPTPMPKSGTEAEAPVPTATADAAA